MKLPPTDGIPWNARHRVLAAVRSKTHVFAVYHSRLDDTMQWADPAVLRVIRMAPSDFEASVAGCPVPDHADLVVMEQHWVDARCQGPRSKYGKTLAAMKASLPGLVERDDNSMAVVHPENMKNDGEVPRRRCQR